MIMSVDRLQLSVVLLIPVAVLILVSLSDHGCVSATSLEVCNDRPDFSNYSTPTTGQALSGSLYIDKNNPFTCYGIVKEWRFCYKRSPGIISDTLKIGLYQLEGSSYVKKGSNSIFLQLQDSECLTVDANPELIVQQGYVVAFIATSIYIKFYDISESGHLYKTVAFPNSFLSGILIKTSNEYAPKLQAYVDNLETTTTTIIPSTTSSAIATTSTINSASSSIVSMTTPLSQTDSSSIVTPSTSSTGSASSLGVSSNSLFMSMSLPDTVTVSSFYLTPTLSYESAMSSNSTNSLPLASTVSTLSSLPSFSRVSNNTSQVSPTSTSPPISGQAIAFIISGSVVGLLIFVFFVIIGLLVLIMRKKYFGRTYPLLGAVEVHTDMEYNLNYLPSSPNNVDTKRSSIVRFKENPSYSVSSLGAPPLVDSVDHVYETLVTVNN